MSNIKAAEIMESLPASTYSNGMVFGTIPEDSGCTVMARIAGSNNVNLIITDVTSITTRVFDLDSATPGTAAASPALVVATVFFSTLQTDGRWTYDSTGYNFRHQFVSTTFATGDHRYRIEITLDLASGENMTLPLCEVNVVETHSEISGS